MKMMDFLTEMKRIVVYPSNREKPFIMMTTTHEVSATFSALPQWLFYVVSVYPAWAFLPDERNRKVV
jgi:hypothetical protein